MNSRIASAAGAAAFWRAPMARIPAASASAAAATSRPAPSAPLPTTSLTLKLRRHDRYTTTHACRLHDPTQRAETILAAVTPVLRAKLDGTRYRLVGVTAHDLVPGQRADPPDLFDWS